MTGCDMTLLSHMALSVLLGAALLGACACISSILALTVMFAVEHVTLRVLGAAVYVPVFLVLMAAMVTGAAMLVLQAGR